MTTDTQERVGLDDFVIINQMFESIEDKVLGFLACVAAGQFLEGEGKDRLPGFLMFLNTAPFLKLLRQPIRIEIINTLLKFISAPETLKKALPKLIDGQKLKRRPTMKIWYRQLAI